MKRLIGIVVVGLVWCTSGDNEPVGVTTASLTLDARTQVFTQSIVDETLETWTFSSVSTVQDQKIDTSTPLGTLVLIH